MWRLAISELSKRTVYRGQKLLFMGTIKATIKHIYINGQSVSSGFFSPTTKPVFRSESARYVLFIQMSKEMWYFDTEGAGEIMFNKVVSGFLPDLFKRWLKINARHLVTIILFTRMQYDKGALSDNLDSTTNEPGPRSRLEDHRDFYRVVVSDMASGDWINILYQLKKEFRSFLQEVSLMKTASDKNKRAHSENSGRDHSWPETIIAGKPSSASQGNILEAINLAAAQFAKDYIDRDLVRTGISVIVVTPGTGVFEVDYNMLKLTTDTLMGSGIGIDLVCLSPMPLHSVPLFKYQSPRQASTLRSTTTKNTDGRISPVRRSFDQDDKTPRQYNPYLGSTNRGSSETSLLPLHTELVELPHEPSEDWRYAMPYWVDVSFWSGTSDDNIDLTKPRRADNVVRRSRKQGRIFSLRCRLYELQMMGVMDNEFGDISVPYMDESPSHKHLYEHATNPSKNHEQANLPLWQTVAAAPGSYSSRGDKDYVVGQLDEIRMARKAWMEAHDDEVFSSCASKGVVYHQLTQSGANREESSHVPRDPSLSNSFRSVGLSFNKAIRLPHEINPPKEMHEGSKSLRGMSPRSKADHVADQSVVGVPRADVLRRQKTLTKHIANNDSLSHQPSAGLCEAPKQHQTLRTMTSHSPISSSGQSPARKSDAIANMINPIASTGTEARKRPSNWILRQISFGGKAAAAQPTISDATIDISHGKVKPAMLTVEKNQKGAIAERLASTRLTTAETPSQPIAIRTASRTGLSASDSPSPDRGGRSVETVRGVRSDRSTVTSQPSSVVKTAGSTFLLAGSRALGETIPTKPTLSSSGGAKEIPRTLSPTSAIAPWAVLVNPCNPRKNSINPRNQFRRWHHVFPRTIRTSTVKWRSLCSPAAVPLTHEWFPTGDQIAAEYNESPYKITQNEDDDLPEGSKSRESLIRELIAFRLSHGFQIIVGSSVAEFSGQQEKDLASILAPEYMSADGDTVFMSVGSSIHQLVCVAGGEVEVKRYNRKPTTALESSAGIDTPFPYKAFIRTAFEHNYDLRNIVLRPPRKEYNWNLIDTFLAGYHDEFSDVLRFWRARFVLIPVEIPMMSRRPLPMLAEDSEEEIRLEGIRKLTQLWQKFRYIPPEERHAQTGTFKKQKDPNPLAIEYHTRDPSAIVAAGPEVALFTQTESELQNWLFSDSEKYQASNLDLKKLAEDLQGEKGIQMIDRRWHWKLHYTCFVGFDLVNWLLSNFKDIETRDEAVELGNELMAKGLFIHVQKRHQFRDGNFFFQIAAEYRAPRPESRIGWFGMRKADKSAPSTPLTEGSRSSPSTAKNNHGSWPRPGTADSSGTSDSGQEGEKTPTRNSTSKRKVKLSGMMRYDVDSRKRSYRPEIISLHYDRLHNPDNCYHIRIDWMNVTAKLIEDAIVTWATSVEKYGLKLVEVPIDECSSIVDHHPFRSPYSVELALQPPQAPQEVTWDSINLPPQYSKTDRFAYHKALLRRLNFVLDMEAANSFPTGVEVTYSWGRNEYKHTQFIHRSGTLLAQITDEGNFLLLANRLAHNRAKDNSRIRVTDPYDHKKASTSAEGTQSGRLPSTPAMERANPHRSPFSSPLARPIQDSSLLHMAFQDNSNNKPSGNVSPQTPEQVKDEVEAFCSDANLLSSFYSEVFKQAPSPSPRILPVLDNNIPNLGLPPAISIREASPANTGWTLSSTSISRGGIGSIPESGIAGRRQGSETGSMLTLGKRTSIVEANAADGPRRQGSQGSLGDEGPTRP